MSLANPTPSVPAELAARGYQAGPPAHVGPATLALDRSIYARARCPGCGCRTSFLPLHYGDEYAAVLACACGHHEEV